MESSWLVEAMCAYGMIARGPQGWGPVAKATRIATNSRAIAEKLSVRCSQDHYHVELKGGRRCADAAVYPDALCDAILEGYLIESANNVEMVGHLYQCAMPDDMCDSSEETLMETHVGTDDVTGEKPRPNRPLEKKGKA